MVTTQCWRQLTRVVSRGRLKRLMCSEKNQYKGWFQNIARGEIEPDGYEPLCLWLIPILLRSRKQYYNNAVADTKKLIEWYWKSSKHIYHSFGEFEQSDFVGQTWERKCPLWWGLNDIIGWIDVRVCAREREFQVSLFLPTKRISKRLKDKQYFCHSRQTIALGERATNRELRTTLINCVEEISADKKLTKRHIDLARWRRLVHHFDIVGVIREAAEVDIKLLSKEQKL